MIPLTESLRTASTRLVLACLLAGSMVGAMLGAAAGFIWAQKHDAGVQRAPGASAQSNQQLAQQLQQLQVEIETLRQAVGKPNVVDERAENAATVAVDSESAAAALQEGLIDPFGVAVTAPTAGRFKEPDYDKAMQRLMAAGFSAYDAERIFALEAEAQLQFIDTMSNPALRRGLAAHEIITDLGENLREYLGDYGYENYLRSKKLPTAVEVIRVAKDSAGASAGLRQGDEIMRYAGRRVYNIGDLNRLVQQGQSGQRVSIQVMRQGNIETLEIPAGAIGITSRPFSPHAVFDLR